LIGIFFGFGKYPKFLGLNIGGNYGFYKIKI
jgi:hypothetical protein